MIGTATGILFHSSAKFRKSHTGHFFFNTQKNTIVLERFKGIAYTF